MPQRAPERAADAAGPASAACRCAREAAPSAAARASESSKDPSAACSGSRSHAHRAGIRTRHYAPPTPTTNHHRTCSRTRALKRASSSSAAESGAAPSSPSEPDARCGCREACGALASSLPVVSIGTDRLQPSSPRLHAKVHCILLSLQLPPYTNAVPIPREQ